MQVYSDFDSYTSGVYSYVGGYLRGGHAILLVGYDDAGSISSARTAGDLVGRVGYFRIAYSQLNSVVNFGAYTLAYDDAILLTRQRQSRSRRAYQGPHRIPGCLLHLLDRRFRIERRTLRAILF